MISLNFPPSGCCLHSWSHGPVLTSFQVLAFVFTSLSFFYDLCMLSCFSHVQLFAIPWTAGLQASLTFLISQSLLKLMSIQLLMPSNHLILCCPLLLLPSIFPSIKVFSNESTLHIRWPKYWSFSISPSNEYSRLLAFKIDLFGLLVVQEILKSLLQHCSSNASIL